MKGFPLRPASEVSRRRVVGRLLPGVTPTPGALLRFGGGVPWLLGAPWTLWVLLALALFSTLGAELTLAAKN